MINPFSKCPGCGSDNLEVTFAMVMREKCHNCEFFTQRRVTPIVRGGRGMLQHLVDHLITDDGHLPALETTLQQQLAKVERREAKRRNRGNGGSPNRKEDWR